MLTGSESLYFSATTQTLVTVCLVTLLWALYSRLQRTEFFRAWAWAWTACAVYLLAGTASLELGPVWTLEKASFILVLLGAGFAHAALLVVGGISWQARARSSRRVLRVGLRLALLAALACFAFSFFARQESLLSFAVRNVPRTLALAGALLFCCVVFWKEYRNSGSWAAAITGLFCLAYAIDQSLYCLSFTEMIASHWNLHFPRLLHSLASLEFIGHFRLLALDLLDTCGICLGMILLLVERFEDTATELRASEQERMGLAEDNLSLQIEILTRKRMEEELRKSEEFSRQVVQNSPVAMVVSRWPSQLVESINAKFTSLFGYTLDEMRTVADWWPLAYPDGEYRKFIQERWQALAEQANQGAENLSMESRVRCKDGDFREIEFHLSRVNDLYLVSFVDLTDRKKAMGDLQESESRYRDLVENSEDLIGTHRLDGQLLTINEAPCRRLGYTVEEVLKMKVQDLLAARYQHLYPYFLQQVLEKGEAKGLMVVRTRQGEERVWDYTSTLRRNGTSEPVVRGMAHDVTERIRAEEALRLSEAKFATAFRASPHAMTITSLRDGRFIDVNASFERQSGYTRDEVLGKTLLEIGMWADSADFAAIMTDSLKRKKVVGRKARLRTKSGRVVYALYSVEVIDLGGEPCALVVGEDITERLEIEVALRESESKFRLVADTVNSAIWLLQDERFVYFNKEFERITGYTREEILAIYPWDLVAPEMRDANFTRSQARLAGEAVPPRYQFAILHKNGEKRWLDFSAALTEFNGKPAILASALDITATKRAEQDLKEHAMYMDALIANVPLGIVIKDEYQRVRFCNPAFEQMFLYKQEEIQGKNLDEVIAPNDRQEAEQLSSVVNGGGVVHTTARRQRKDGTFIDVELHGVKVFSGDSFVGAFAIYQDITERRKAEEKLVALRSRLARAQEEERARIARDLHDDAGQRLALLSIDLEQLKQDSMRLKSSLTQQLEALVKAASEITTDVHNVSRRLHPSQVELLGLSAALSNFCKDFAAHNGVEVVFVNASLSQKPPQDGALCLFRVAQEAIRNVQKHSGARKAIVQLDEIGGSMRLRVSDQGRGFDPEAPDFSQGLGLLSMQERLHSLGGELFVHSRCGGGTCIEACIPLSATVPSK
ncbi:MAG TPA: PAS domain S-box protein [Verrucomicrobiae bacterium]|nr:PAS domain S-box protein [Verrucomicrobiae bacterium]